ncbi:MAG: HPr family phosphocarrier protein [Oscillospiraceae bacterium]|nr:HPr family phosphocarrier protein [Oscillospiraceae bacterium]
MTTFTHIIRDPMGLHARPAAALVKACAAYQCAITVANGSAKCDAKRLMAVMRLGAKNGAELTITCDGTDEEAAAAGLQAFLADNL